MTTYTCDYTVQCASGTRNHETSVFVISSSVKLLPHFAMCLCMCLTAMAVLHQHKPPKCVYAFALVFSVCLGSQDEED